MGFNLGKMIVKEYQEVRDKALLELRKNVSSNRDILPEEFIKTWQDFEEQNNELQLKEAKEWTKLKEFRIDSYFTRFLNIFLILCLFSGILMNFAVGYVYYQCRTDALETINKIKDHE